MVIITPISDKKKSTVPEPDTVLFGGDYRDRTGDLLHAMQALSQLSYTPELSCFRKEWRPYGDSNPGTNRERVVS